MASKRIEEQVSQNAIAIQSLVDNAKQLHELPSIISFEDDDRFLVQIDSTKESVYVTWQELLNFMTSTTTSFLGLSDTPTDYTGQAGKIATVNLAETGLDFEDAASGGVDTFLELTDTPSSFSSKRRQNVKVNAAGDALEFTPDYMDFACSDEESDLEVKLYVFEMVCNRDYKDVSGFHFSVTTAPTGSPVIVDVFKNGTSVYFTQPEIEIGELSTHTSATPGTLAQTNADFSIGDRLQVSVEQKGSTIAGKGLKCTMTYNNFIPV